MQARPLDDHDGLVAAARRIESLGYAELFSYDHVGTVDPFIPLAVAAEATTTLRVGPLVLNNELHHPALLARTAATVDRLSGGRLVVGLGTGYAHDEHEATGIPLRPPAARVERFEESVIALRSLLDTGGVQFDGVYHALHIDDLGIRPLQTRVPLLIGGHGKRVVGIAARHADIFQFTGLTHTVDDEGRGKPTAAGFAIDALRERARWLADAAGDRADDIERSALVQHIDVDTRDSAPSAARLDELADRFHLPADVVAETPFVLVGSPEQIIDKLERVRADLGITHYVVREAEAFAPIVAALAGR
jgi:probable F420-dependent oxidoreductase